MPGNGVRRLRAARARSGTNIPGLVCPVDARYVFCVDAIGDTGLQEGIHQLELVVIVAKPDRVTKLVAHHASYIIVIRGWLPGAIVPGRATAIIDLDSEAVPCAAIIGGTHTSQPKVAAALSTKLGRVGQ